jgi:hypothetical protein
MLSNSGAAVLHITSVALSGANISDFLLASNTCNGAIVAGANCMISVVFKAGQTASYNLQLIPEFAGTLTFQCAGVPLAATCSVPSSMAVTSGIPYPLTVTISTTGAGAKLVPQPPRWFPSLRGTERVFCLLFALIAAIRAISRCDRDAFVRDILLPR